MRKQNSTSRSAFISEAGSELENNDYFARDDVEDDKMDGIIDAINYYTPERQERKDAYERCMEKYEKYAESVYNGNGSLERRTTHERHLRKLP